MKKTSQTSACLFFTHLAIYNIGSGIIGSAIGFLSVIHDCIKRVSSQGGKIGSGCGTTVGSGMDMGEAENVGEGFLGSGFGGRSITHGIPYSSREHGLIVGKGKSTGDGKDLMHGRSAISSQGGSVGHGLIVGRVEGRGILVGNGDGLGHGLHPRYPGRFHRHGQVHLSSGHAFVSSPGGKLPSGRRHQNDGIGCSEVTSKTTGLSRYAGVTG